MAVGFGACVFVSAGTCLAVGVATAGVHAYASTKKRGRWGVHRKKFARNFAWGVAAAAGGYGTGRYIIGRAYDRIRRGRFHYSRMSVGIGTGVTGYAGWECARYRNKQCRSRRR